MGKLLFVLIFTGLAYQVSAQYLLLQKTNRPYQVIFEEGEHLRFKLKGEKFWRRALIQGFDDDQVVFHYYTIHKDEFALIDQVVEHRKNTKEGKS